MSKTTSSAAVDETRVYPLRTGKIRLTKGTASEINRAVGVRPSEAEFAERLIRHYSAALGATPKSALKKKPDRSG